MSTDSVLWLRNVRRNLSSVLINLPIDTRHTSIATLMELLEYFSEHPDKYMEMIREDE